MYEKSYIIKGQERTLFGVLFLCQFRDLPLQLRDALGLVGLVLAVREVFFG